MRAERDEEEEGGEASAVHNIGLHVPHDSMRELALPPQPPLLNNDNIYINKIN